MIEPQNTYSISILTQRSTEFCRDSLRPVSWFYLAWLVVAGIISYVVYFITKNSPLGSVRPALLIYYLAVGIHLFLRLRKDGRANILSPDILFLLFYSAFHLGYVALYDIGVVPYSSPPFIFQSSIPKSLFVVNLGLMSFIFGYEILGRKGQGTVPQIRIPRASWCVFGLTCMIVAVVSHLSVIGYLGTGIFRQYGHKALQDIEKYIGSFLIALIWRYSLHLMVLGIVVYTVSSALRYGKLFQTKLALVVILILSAFLLMEGERGGILQLGVPILLIRHYFVKRVKIRYLVGIVFSVAVLFTAMGLVRTIVFEPAKMLEEYQYQKASGLVTWLNLPLEAGNSYQTLNITTREVPSIEGYWYGASWRDSIIHIVPFLQGVATRLGISTWAPSAWVTTTYFGTNVAGRGFTIAAEGYLNFGYVGVIVELMFFGAFLRWLTIKFSRYPSALWGVIMLGCLGIAIITVRNHVGVMFASCVRIMVVAFLLNLFLKSEPVYEYEMEEYDELYQDEMTYV